MCVKIEIWHRGMGRKDGGKWRRLGTITSVTLGRGKHQKSIKNLQMVIRCNWIIMDALILTLICISTPAFPTTTTTWTKTTATTATTATTTTTATQNKEKMPDDEDVDRAADDDGSINRMSLIIHAFVIFVTTAFSSRISTIRLPSSTLLIIIPSHHHHHHHHHHPPFHRTSSEMIEDYWR